MSRNILFHCTTAYTAFNAAVISKLWYSSDTTILLVPTSRDIFKFYEILKKNNSIFSNVLILEENGLDKSKTDIQYIIDRYAIDIYHFFILNPYVIQFINLLDSNVKIILTEEGTLTYQPIAHTKQSIDNGRLTYIEEGELIRLFDRVDEVAVYEPKMFDGSLDVPVTKIDISQITNSKHANEYISALNDLFGYRHSNMISKYIYFDVYFSEGNFIKIDYEREFLQNLLNIFSESDFCVKLHPHESKEYGRYRYKYKDVKTMDMSNIPWELILLNILINDKRTPLVLMSIDSTAIFNSLLLCEGLDNDIEVISFIEMFKTEFYDYCVYEKKYNNAQKFKEIFPETKYYIAKSFDDFEDVLMKYQDVNHKIRCNFKYEDKDISRMVKNTVSKSELVLNNKRYTSYFDFAQKNTSVCFELRDIIMMNRFELILGDINLFTRISKLEIFINANKKDVIIWNDVDRISGHIKLVDNKIIGQFIMQDNEYIDKVIIKFNIEDLYSYDKAVKDIQNGIRTKKYYQFMCKWMLSDTKGDNILCKLKKMNANNIAVYGNGSISRIVTGQLYGKVERLCYIVSDGNYLNGNIEVYPLNMVNQMSFIPDIIIVTPIYESDIIIQEITGRMEGNVRAISIEELFE